MVSSEAAQLLTILVSGVTGVAVGSFLNVVVYRLPRRMSIIQPPSHCPACGSQLSIVDLLPVLSWLWLHGRCRHCSAAISLRYPLVELAAGVLCAAAAAAVGSLWPLPSIAVLALCALAASLVDADGGALPVALTIVSSLAAVSLLPLAAALGHADRIAWAALGALLGLAAALICDRAADRQRLQRIALLGELGWAAGWLWAGGGAFVAAWIVVATAATGLGARRRAPFAMLAAGSVIALLASALVGRP
jgi:leader peptidase (prepilin peptidase)/N-methyltransferase